MSHTQKYLKYKSKYLNIKGGAAVASVSTAEQLREERKIRQEKRKQARDAADAADMPYGPAIRIPMEKIHPEMLPSQKKMLLEKQLVEQKKELATQVIFWKRGFIEDAICETEDDLADMNDILFCSGP
jgi:hypothetical protein